jgi:hypothetical protein
MESIDRREGQLIATGGKKKRKIARRGRRSREKGEGGQVECAQHKHQHSTAQHRTERSPAQHQPKGQKKSTQQLSAVQSLVLVARSLSGRAVVSSWMDGRWLDVPDVPLYRWHSEPGKA